MKRNKVEVGTPTDYHGGKPKTFVGENVIITFKMDGYDITIQRNGDKLEVRNDNGGLLIEPVVANVVYVKGRER